MINRNSAQARGHSENKSKIKNTRSSPRTANPKNILVSKNVNEGARSKSRSDPSNLAKVKDPSTDFINHAIHEYLNHKDMLITLDYFRNEVARGSPEKKNHNINIESHIFEAFEKGNRETFFKKWNTFIPVSIRSNDEYCNKIEFYLHLYFVVFYLHPFTKKPPTKSGKPRHDLNLDRQEVQYFKHYLETKGQRLAQTSEFLQFYALPYIQNPMHHPSFKDVFTREWIIELKSKLQSFLEQVGSNEHLPVLYQMYEAYVKSGNGIVTKTRVGGEYETTITQLEANNQDLMNLLQDYSEKYEGLSKNYEIVKRNEEIVRNHLIESNVKWINFLKEIIILTNESIQVIDSQKIGNNIPDNVIDIIKKKLQRYETFLNSNQEELFSNSQDNSFIDKVSTSQEAGTPDHSTLSNVHNKFQFEERPAVYVQQYALLNFEKVKSFLVNSNNTEASITSLIQALRWRIAKTPGISLRREVILSYSKNDLLDLHRKEPCVLETILRHESQKIRESAARLINVLTLDYSGRSYLLGSDKLVSMLIESLKAEKKDNVIRKNCLGALQKLSLRRRPQLLMIEQDMIKWIVSTLKNEKDILSEYSYEYATALFMNLSLRSLGKKKCEELEMEVLKVLNDLLEHESMQVRSFVNGTLYSLLSKSVFKEHAKALGMNEVLSYLMENSDERYRKQIQYILEQLTTDKTTDDETQSDSNDEDNDYDDVEDDEDFGEDEHTEETLTNPNVLTGEDLLKKHFSLSGPGDQQLNHTIKETLSDSRSQTTLRQTRFDPHSPLNRPTTPGMLSKALQQDTAQNLPEGFETKPKIPRTPLDNTQEEFYPNNYQQAYGNNSQGQNTSTRQSNSQQKGGHSRPGYMNQGYDVKGIADRERRGSKRQDPNSSQGEENRYSLDHSQRNEYSPPKTEKEIQREQKQKEYPEEFYQAFESKPKLPRSTQSNVRPKNF